MNKVNIAALLMALLVVGAIAAPRKVLETNEASEAAATSEQHQRILAELEEVSALRERMLQEGEISSQFCRFGLSGEALHDLSLHFVSACQMLARGAWLC